MNIRDYFFLWPRGRYDAAISDESVGRAAALSPSFGEAASDAHIFECALHLPGNEADYSQRAGRDAVPSFLHALRTELLPFMEMPAWARIRAFFEGWESDPAYLGIDEFWFEFDYDALAGDIPRPCCFFDAGELATPAGRERIFTGSLAVLLGGAPQTALRETITRCACAHPEGVRPYQLGVMLARGDDPRPVRMFSGDLCAAQVMPYLRAIGWGSAQELGGVEQLVTWTSELSNDRYNIDFDVTADGLSRKIGINCGARDADAFLDALCARHLALPHKSDAVKCWLRDQTGEMPIGRLNHFKLPFEGNVLGSKAYLWHRLVVARK